MRPRRHGKPHVEGLEARALLSTMMTESEPNNRPSQANVIKVDPADGKAVIQGSSVCLCDRDYYTYTPNTLSQIDLSALSQTSTLRFTLLVKDAAGRVLFSSGGGRQGVDQTAAQFTVHTNQKFYIEVVSRGEGLGNYTINFMVTDLKPPIGGGGIGTPEPPNVLNETEPNNTPPQANAFDLGNDGMIQIQAAINDLQDRDYFTFVPRVSGQVSLQLTPQGCNPAVIVRNQAGTVLFASPHSKEGGASGTFPVRAGQRIFIETTTQGRGIGDYSIDLQETVHQPGQPTTPTGLVNETEPNNTITTANAFALDASGNAVLSGTISPTDIDVFTFTAPYSGQLSVSNLTPTAPLTVQFFSNPPSSSLPTTAQSLVSGTPVTIPVSQGSKYYLQLADSGGFLTPYQVSLMLTRNP